MIGIRVVVVVFALLFLGILLRRYKVRERRRELFVLKRHAASYAEQDKHL
jgi:hypothetical protein